MSTTATATVNPVDLNIATAEASKLGELQVVTPENVANLAVEAVNSEFKPTTTLNEDEVVSAMAEIDLTKTNTITMFGASAADQATAVSQQMLDGVRNKDTGPAGDIMKQMVLKFQSLDPESLKEGNFITKWLKSQASKVADFKADLDKVNDQIAGMVQNLDEHQITMMTDVAKLDRLFDATVVQFHELEVYIVAGQRRLDQLNDDELPAMQALVEAEKPGADGTPASLMPQKFADLQNRRDQLERKIYDLKLVRQVSLMALPQIRQTQDTDNALIAKIETIKSTTIPVWYQQMALALTVQNTQNAADATNDVTDATEMMMKKQSEAYKVAQIEARKSVERSVVSIETLETVNNNMIETLDETVRITEEGKMARAKGVAILQSQEAALTSALKRTAKSQDAYAAIMKDDDDVPALADNSDGGAE